MDKLEKDANYCQPYVMPPLSEYVLYEWVYYGSKVVWNDDGSMTEVQYKLDKPYRRKVS